MHANAAKQSSPARVAASRANGRLSRGPKTLSGKLRSCSNNRRHGLAGTSLILPNESAADFDTSAPPTSPNSVALSSGAAPTSANTLLPAESRLAPPPYTRVLNYN